MNLRQLEFLIAEIKRVSFTDDKTSLGNALALHYEGQRMNEGTSEFSVVVFGDLNDFKQLNEGHGYVAGDVAIYNVGETITKIVGALQSKAFRQSGDEFVILLKADSVKSFLSTATSFSNISFFHKGEELRTAMSHGYAVADGKTSFDDLLKRAEDACKHAKAKGDDACVEWTEDIKVNPLVRRGGRCLKCNARITCNVPEQSAPARLKFCPCCGESL